MVYVLRKDSFRPVLGEYYSAEVMNNKAGAAHMDAVGRRVFQITAVVCVAVKSLGYSVSKRFTESAIAKIGWWLMFFANVIGACLVKQRDGKNG